MLHPCFARITLLCVITFISKQASAQVNWCDMVEDGTPAPSQLGISCGTSIHFAPIHPEEVPLKYSRIAFHVMQDEMA